MSLAQTLAQALILVPEIQWVDDVIFPVVDTPVIIPHSRLGAVPKGWVANPVTSGTVSFYATVGDRARWGSILVLRSTVAVVRAKIGIIF